MAVCIDKTISVDGVVACGALNDSVCLASSTAIHDVWHRTAYGNHQQ